MRKIDTGLGREIDAALEELYALYDRKVIDWFAGLWDGEIGGFYYSVSARDHEGFLPDILGYAAVPTFPPILSGGEGWLDFTSIPDPRARLNAKYLAIAVSGHLLSNRFRYHTMEEAVADILEVSLDFLNRLP